MPGVLLLLIVMIPVAGAFLLPLLGRFSARLRNIASLFFVASSFILTLCILPEILGGGTVNFTIQAPLGLSFILNADGLAVFMALVSSFISLIIVLYSFAYISHYENQGEYYLMVTLFIGSMMGLVFSGSLIYLYLFWEITALACWRLIGFFREKDHVWKADKAFLVTVLGSLAMLIGFLYIYQQTGTFEMGIITAFYRSSTVPDIAVLLILCGILSKSATLPFHTWLPDAGVAPSPVTALLHAAVLVKIGVYAYARLFGVTMPISDIWHVVVPVVAGVSALVSGGAALIETDIKRIIAYSTVSQIGFIFLGLSIGNPVGMSGGLLYILMHGLAKAGLFLSAGIIEQNMHTKDVRKMGGLIKTMPVTAFCFILCSFSVIGIPPFGGFFSKYLVFNGVFQANQLWIGILFLLCAVLTLAYLLRVFVLIFLAEPKSEPVKEGSPIMITSVAVLAALSLIGGVFVYFPYEFISKFIK